MPTPDGKPTFVEFAIDVANRRTSDPESVRQYFTLFTKGNYVSSSIKLPKTLLDWSKLVFAYESSYNRDIECGFRYPCEFSSSGSLINFTDSALDESVYYRDNRGIYFHYSPEEQQFNGVDFTGSVLRGSSLIITNSILNGTYIEMDYSDFHNVTGQSCEIRDGVTTTFRDSVFSSLVIDANHVDILDSKFVNSSFYLESHWDRSTMIVANAYFSASRLLASLYDYHSTKSPLLFLKGTTFHKTNLFGYDIANTHDNIYQDVKFDSCDVKLNPANNYFNISCHSSNFHFVTPINVTIKSTQFDFSNGIHKNCLFNFSEPFIVNFTNSTFTDTHFLNLTNSILDESTFTKCKFDDVTNSTLISSHFNAGELENLKNCDFFGSVFDSSHIKTVFSSNFTDALFTKSHLNLQKINDSAEDAGNSFNRAKARLSFFKMITSPRDQFTDADFRGNDFQQNTFVVGDRSLISGVDFRGSNLQNFTLFDTKMKRFYQGCDLKTMFKYVYQIQFDELTVFDCQKPQTIILPTPTSTNATPTSITQLLNNESRNLSELQSSARLALILAFFSVCLTVIMAIPICRFLLKKSFEFYEYMKTPSSLEEGIELQKFFPEVNTEEDGEVQALIPGLPDEVVAIHIMKLLDPKTRASLALTHYRMSQFVSDIPYEIINSEGQERFLTNAYIKSNIEQQERLEKRLRTTLLAEQPVRTLATRRFQQTPLFASILISILPCILSLTSAGYLIYAEHFRKEDEVSLHSLDFAAKIILGLSSFLLICICLDSIICSRAAQNYRLRFFARQVQKREVEANQIIREIANKQETTDALSEQYPQVEPVASTLLNAV